MPSRILFDRDVFCLKTTVDERRKIVMREWFQTKQSRPTAQRGVQFEVRILGRRPDQDHRSVLDGRKQRILLRDVEPVDLVDEDDRFAVLFTQTTPSGGDCLANVLDSRRDRRKADELGLRRIGDDLGERRLAGSGWPPEDDRRQSVIFDESTQWTPRGKQMRLADDVVEPTRAESRSERGLATQLFARRVGEQVVRRGRLLRRGRQHAYAEFGELCGIDLRGRVRHRIEARLRLWEGDHLADVLLTREIGRAHV